MNSLSQGFFNNARTENGAVTFKNTGNPLLDYFYHASARRGQDNTGLFESAYKSDKVGAILAAFYTRDPRHGQGERETFRQVLRYLFVNDRSMFNTILPFVPEYGRWDDILEFISPTVVEMVRSQLNSDYTAKNPSLLAKWMPSENTSSKETVKLARKWIAALGTNAKTYRRKISKMRAKIKIVESLMSAGNWSEIDYSRVPSRASTIYRKAFGKRDTSRYGEYLAAVKAGTKKINASVLYPYELVNKFIDGYARPDETIEMQWKALPDYVNGVNAIVICDTSGSMLSAHIPNTPAPISVAISLAIYFAERSTGAFRNMWINFNSEAKAYKLVGSTLRDHVQAMVNNNDWGGSTNLQSAFDLILSTAKRYNVPAQDMPERLFVVSDMEFNPSGLMTNYEVYRQKFAASGYVIPKIVFWNVNSRNTQTPVTQHSTGAYLVSGCSPSIFKTALNTSALTPLQMMWDVLNSERYASIKNVLERM